MKKIVFVLIAVLTVSGLGLSMASALHAEDAAATAPATSVSCPACKVEIPAGEKPVLSMLAGKSHTCPSCDKAFDVAATQEVPVCSHCGGQILTCPSCGKTELIPKA